MTLPARLFAAGLALPAAMPAGAAPIHTSWLWHMHRPIDRPDLSAADGAAYEPAFETISLGHGQSDAFSIFDRDDRVHAYQDYPKMALQSVLDLPDAGAKVSFAGSLIQNVRSLASNGWNGGRYAAGGYQPYRGRASGALAVPADLRAGASRRSAGVCFLRASAGSRSDTRRIVLLP